MPNLLNSFDDCYRRFYAKVMIAQEKILWKSFDDVFCFIATFFSQPFPLLFFQWTRQSEAKSFIFFLLSYHSQMIAIYHSFFILFSFTPHYGRWILLNHTHTHTHCSLVAMSFTQRNPFVLANFFFFLSPKRFVFVESCMMMQSISHTHTHIETSYLFKLKNRNGLRWTILYICGSDHKINGLIVCLKIYIHTQSALFFSSFHFFFFDYYLLCILSCVNNFSEENTKKRDINGCQTGKKELKWCSCISATSMCVWMYIWEQANICILYQIIFFKRSIHILVTMITISYQSILLNACSTLSIWMNFGILLLIMLSILFILHWFFFSFSLFFTYSLPIDSFRRTIFMLIVVSRQQQQQQTKKKNKIETWMKCK